VELGPPETKKQKNKNYAQHKIINPPCFDLASYFGYQRTIFNPVMLFFKAD